MTNLKKTEKALMEMQGWVMGMNPIPAAVTRGRFTAMVDGEPVPFYVGSSSALPGSEAGDFHCHVSVQNDGDEFYLSDFVLDEVAGYIENRSELIAQIGEWYQANFGLDMVSRLTEIREAETAARNAEDIRRWGKILTNEERLLKSFLGEGR